MSDTKSDSCDESDGERYAGYQSLPTLDGSLVITNTDHGEHTNAIVDKDSDEVSPYISLSVLLPFYQIERCCILIFWFRIFFFSFEQYFRF